MPRLTITTATTTPRLPPGQLVKQAGERVLRSIHYRTVNATQVQQELDLIATALAALPLATGTYGVAVNRLRNVTTALHKGELGVVKWELHNLIRSLPRDTTTPVVPAPQP